MKTFCDSWLSIENSVSILINAKSKFFLLEHTSITYLHNESSFRQEEWNSNEVKLDFELHYHRTMWKPRMVLENLYIEILGCVSNVQRLLIKCKFSFFFFQRLNVIFFDKFQFNIFWINFSIISFGTHSKSHEAVFGSWINQLQSLEHSIVNG